MNSQYEYDHQVYPLIRARPPEQNDDSKTKYCPSLVENKTSHCIRYDHLFTLNDASWRICAAAVPDIPPPITITEGIEPCCL